MNKPQFACVKFNDGFRVSHNCDGALGFCAETTVDEATARLIEFAIEEGKRRRSREINDLLRDAYAAHQAKATDARGASRSNDGLGAELNRGGFPVQNAGYWRRQFLAMQELYDAQCACTDEWAEKYRAEIARKADATLLQRVDELENALAVVNARLAASNAQAQRPAESGSGAAQS